MRGSPIETFGASDPRSTYYAALNWDGCYAGLQRARSRYDRQLQFSVWDDPAGGAAQVVALGADIVCSPFEGESTGQKCELNFPWRVGATYRFEITEEDLNGGSALTLHVININLAAGRRRFVATLRYATRADLLGFAMFLEGFSRDAPTCLAQSVRSTAIRRAMARIDGSWLPITRGYLSRQRKMPTIRAHRPAPILPQGLTPPGSKS